MKKNFIILSVIAVLSIILNVITINSRIYYKIIDEKEGNISDYQNMIDGYIPEEGYVPDAVTAVKIAKAILETFLNTKGGTYTVKYDKSEQLWIVRNSRLLRNSQFVIIQQSDGKIVRAWGTK
jgi:hypothetical protein